METRLCAKVGCAREASGTLTYDYADSLVAIGPLSPVRDPHGYDLCSMHSEAMSVPRGWDIIRYSPPRD